MRRFSGTTKIILAIALSFGVAQQAWSATSSVATQEEVTPSLLQKMSLSYYGFFDGPAISKFDSYMPYNERDASGQINLYNSVSLKYLYSDKVNFAFNPRFEYRPGLGNEFKLLEPRIKASRKNWIRSGNFSLDDTTFYVQLDNMNKYARNSGQLVAPALDTAMSYVISGTRLSLVSEQYIRWHIPRSDARDFKTKNFKAYWKPSIAYQLSPKVTAMIAYEVAAIQVRGKDIGDWDSADEAALYLPQFHWNVLPALTFSPFLKIRPGKEKQWSTDSIAAGFELAGTVF